MTTRNSPDSGPTLDPFTLVGTSHDGAWTFTARFVASPTGLKVWSLTIAPKDVPADGPPPQDVNGAGINTSVLKMISFPQIRDLMKRQTGGYLTRVRDELERASPGDRELVEHELDRAEREASRSEPPKTNRPGRPATDDNQRAQWAIDVLEFKDQHGFRRELRQLWADREGRQLRERTVDTRMRRLRDDDWLTGIGRAALPGSELKRWLKNRSKAEQSAEQE